MKFCLFVVHPIEDKLDVGNLWALWVEVGKKSNVEEMGSVGVALLVDRLDFFEQAAFFYFLVIKKIFEK